MKMKDVILSKKDQIVHEAKRWGIVTVDLFGSCARGEEREDSDVDLAVFSRVCGEMVENDKAFSRQLETLLGREVHVTNKRGIAKDKQFWDRVSKEAISVVGCGEGASLK